MNCDDGTFFLFDGKVISENVTMNIYNQKTNPNYAIKTLSHFTCLDTKSCSILKRWVKQKIRIVRDGSIAERDACNLRRTFQHIYSPNILQTKKYTLWHSNKETDNINTPQYFNKPNSLIATIYNASSVKFIAYVQKILVTIQVIT